MKKYVMLLSAAVVAAVVSGCVRTSTLEWLPAEPGEISSSGREIAYHLKARNCGLYIFNTLPVWSGSTTRPNRREYTMWKDGVNEWDMRRLLDSQLHKLGADRVEDIKMSSYSSGAWGLWIFWKKSMVATGLAVKNASKQKKR
jgi:hypothetical protein